MCNEMHREMRKEISNELRGEVHREITGKLSLLSLFLLSFVFADLILLVRFNYTCYL